MAAVLLFMAAALLFVAAALLFEQLSSKESRSSPWYVVLHRRPTVGRAPPAAI
jgi:hypothetical protein